MTIIGQQMLMAAPVPEAMPEASPTIGLIIRAIRNRNGNGNGNGK